MSDESRKGRTQYLAGWSLGQVPCGKVGSSRGTISTDRLDLGSKKNRWNSIVLFIKVCTKNLKVGDGEGIL